MKILITFLTASSLLTSCSTMKESLISGATIGLAGGAVLGNARGTGRERDKSTRNGAMIGALLGAGIAYLGYRDKSKQKAARSTKNKNAAPLLTQPKIKRIWVDDKVNGKRFIKGHWEYIIQEQSVWSQ